MISQKQNTMHWSEEETPPPLDQEQTATATSSYWQSNEYWRSDEGQKLLKELDQELYATSSWRGWSLWLRILGVVGVLVASIAFFFPGSIPIAFPLEILLGVLSVGLLRSWWSLLFVPIVLSLVFFLAMFLWGGGFEQWAAINFEGLDLLVYVIVLVEIGVAIVTPISKKIVQLSRKIVQRHRATA